MPTQRTTAVLEVAGAHWATEKALTEETLGQRPGVLAVQADPIAQTAVVTYDPAQTSMAELAAWVRECGRRCTGRSVAAHRTRSAAPTGTLDPGPIGDQLPTTTRWRRFTPWQGPATRVDLALMGAILAVVALGLVLRPLEPFLLASHPVALEFLTGDLTAIGAAAAFARIGEAPLWLVVVAGAVGMVKFDWLTWWIGRRWGGGIIKMLTTSERAQRVAARATEVNPWILRAAVVLAVLPGVPTAVVYAMAGWARMRLATFLLLDLAGALLMTGLVAGLGYGLGQRAVDLVLLIDEYASAVSLTMITLAAVIPLIKRRIRRNR
jgi:membrane protein DedA with SNARE-associated domain/copper chaperone CopZ